MINVQIDVDPTKSFTGVSKEKLFQTTGLIPYFVRDTALSRPEGATEALELMEECYGFPRRDVKGDEGRVLVNGVYLYPGDPALAPVVSFKLLDTKEQYSGMIEILVYRYGIVCVRDDHIEHVVRMD